MREIVLYGRLRKKFGGPFSLDVATAGEAIRALSINIPGFLDELKIGAYEVICGHRREGLHLEIDDINAFKMGKQKLHLVPATHGAKSGGGTLKTILGVALIGAAVFFSGGTLAAPIMASGPLSGLTWGSVAIVGAGLAVSGVSQLLSPNQAQEKDKNDQSYTISGPGNTYQQGGAVPLIYGETITGSVLASGGLDVERI